jgi:membrane associated rhomboid family serine protease
MNAIWMAAFGSPVAKRFGTIRFLLFTLVCMAAGALLHYLSFMGQFVPVIGASGAVSGYMGAAGRFAFNNMGTGSQRGLRTHGPALSLAQSFTNRQFLVFAGVWMAINFVFGSGIVPVTGQEAGIAWQAHVGGFVAGVMLFSLFDPVQRNREP